MTNEDILRAYEANGKSARKAAVALGMKRTTYREALLRAQAGPAAPTVVRNSGLEQQLRDAERKLREIERDNLKTDAIRQYIFNLAQADCTIPQWVNERRVFGYHHGVPVLFLSDLHHGEVVFPEQVFGANKFDSDISRKRILRTADRAIMLAEDVLKEPQFPGCVLVLGGDCINGDIHEELQIGSDKRVMAQTIDVADILHQVILKLINRFGRVFVVGVPGNHGRTTRKPMAKFYAETNFDWLVYQMIERFMAQQVMAGQVQFLTPPARDVTFRVAGRGFRVTHGDQFRGGDGIIGPLGPITRGDKKKRALATTLPTDSEDYDTLMVAHFHQLYMTPKLIINGSTKGYDEYALANNFEYEPPQQAFFLVHEKYGINHYMPVLADDPVVIEGRAWAEVLK